MDLDDAPERLRKVVRMWEDKYEHGEQFDYMGVTMVRAETPKPLYYPKQKGVKFSRENYGKVTVT